MKCIREFVHTIVLFYLDLLSQIQCKVDNLFYGNNTRNFIQDTANWAEMSITLSFRSVFFLWRLLGKNLVFDYFSLNLYPSDETGCI